LVRNDVPARKGCIACTNCFGGLYRDVELEATPTTWIDNLWVQGDLDRKLAVVHVTVRSIGPATPKATSVEIRVTAPGGRPAGHATRQAVLGEKGAADLAVEVPLGEVEPWSPEDPALYVADAELCDGDHHALHGWRERFGVRKWEVRGKDFYLNNRKHFVRGFGDDSIYPITFCSPASRQQHRRHLELAKQFGFNYVRHHTHCEIPEFYEAADEVGIMVQPELPYYGKLPTEAFTFDPQRDLAELIGHYRRYVSLSTYCMGNEGHLGSPLDHDLYAMIRQRDPTRLTIHEDGGVNTPQNSDFGSGRGAPDWGAYPQEQDPRPWCHHEYLNLAVGRDPRTAPKYTGEYMPPVSPESFYGRLESLGLSRAWGDACLDAGQQLQRIYQKRGLEWARLNPNCHGYIFWTIVSVEGYGDQGLLNQFWEPRASTSEFFQQFNRPTAVLANMTPGHQILTAGDDLKIEWWISHFSPEATGCSRLPTSLYWRVVGDQVDQHGERYSTLTLRTGDVKPFGETVCQIPAVRKPVKGQLQASLTSNTGRLRASTLFNMVPPSFGNSWDLWLFPKPSAKSGAGLCASAVVHQALAGRYSGMAVVGAPESQAAKTLVTTALDDDARQWLRQGKNVLLLKLAGPAPGVTLGWWGMTKQTGTAIARHPAFGDFPHDGYLNELWFRIVDTTVPAGRPALKSVEPLMVGDGSLGYLIHVFQAQAGKGKLLASGLDLLDDKPEAACLLDQFLAYVQSDRFQPAGKLDLKQAEADWELWAALTKRINGWAKTTKAFRRVAYPSYWGQRPMCVARQSDEEKLVAWLTQPVPADLGPATSYTFRWFAGLGWLAQPPGKFTLTLGERPLVDFDVVDRDTTWTSPDGAVRLNYTLRDRAGQDNSGIMELTLPARLLTPGQPAELRVVPAQTGSRRWFGLYEWPQGL
jgi:hypothetical protein